MNPDGNQTSGDREAAQGVGALGVAGRMPWNDLIQVVLEFHVGVSGQPPGAHFRQPYEDVRLSLNGASNHRIHPEIAVTHPEGVWPG